VLTGAILLAVGGWAFWPREVELREPAKPGESGALIWGEGVFSSALELKAWLEARGVNYKAWARKHPEAVELLVAEPGTVEVRPKTAKQSKPARSGTTKPKPAQRAKRPAQTPAQPTNRLVAPPARTIAPAGTDGTWIVIALVALLMALGGALAASVSKLGASSRATGVGIGLMLSATCIGIGFAAAAILS
jgi:hypothetical protein